MRWRATFLNPLVLVMVALSIGGLVGVPVLGSSATGSIPAPTPVASSGTILALTVADQLQPALLPAETAVPDSAPLQANPVIQPSIVATEPPASPTVSAAPPAAALAVAPSTLGATAVPSPTVLPSPAANPVPAKRIGLQSGHWRENELPDEFASLRSNKGAMGSGWAERDVNLDITRRVAALLVAKGYQVDVIPATVPAKYEADVFLSIHGDAHSSAAKRGFKVARAVQSAIPAVDDALVATLYRDYAQITGMPLDDKNITSAMRYYYSFSGRQQHTVASTTPAAILELGFLTNATDRDILLNSPDLVAKAVATSLDNFLKR